MVWQVVRVKGFWFYMLVLGEELVELGEKGYFF